MGGYVFFPPLLEGREKRMAVLLRRAILRLALFAKYRYEGEKCIVGGCVRGSR